MMRRVHSIIGSLLMLIVLTTCTALASPAKEVVYYGPGNAVFLIGGDKSTSQRDLGKLETQLRATAAWGAIKSLAATKSTSYAGSVVRTVFSDTVYVSIPRQLIVVDGTSRTMWLGASPQFNSSQIRLDEVWTFGGLSITVSVPSGSGGFSSSARSASWSGSDTSGQHWEMAHVYSGVSASSLFPLTSVNHAANGSHYFQTTNTWVSANAKKGITSL